jgi:nucleoid-associated protein YgaU
MGIFDKFKKDNKPEPKPDFSNVRSGGSSTAPTAPMAPAPPQPTSTIGSGRTYVVVKGDSLSKIAKREYGDASKWTVIYDANRNLIKDPDLIYPGQELKIPGA